MTGTWEANPESQRSVFGEAGQSKIPVGANTANAYRDDMKCSEKSHQQQASAAIVRS
jgi:hypothetical protein